MIVAMMAALALRLPIAVVGWSPVPDASSYRIFIGGKPLGVVRRAFARVPVLGTITVEVSAANAAGESGKSPRIALQSLRVESSSDLGKWEHSGRVVVEEVPGRKFFRLSF